MHHSHQFRCLSCNVSHCTLHENLRKKWTPFCYTVRGKCCCDLIRRSADISAEGNSIFHDTTQLPLSARNIFSCYPPPIFWQDLLERPHSLGTATSRLLQMIFDYSDHCAVSPRNSKWLQNCLLSEGRTRLRRSPGVRIRACFTLLACVFWVVCTS